VALLRRSGGRRSAAGSRHCPYEIRAGGRNGSSQLLRDPTSTPSPPDSTADLEYQTPSEALTDDSRGVAMIRMNRQLLRDVVPAGGEDL
jgi:hypothetical protein